MRGPKALINLWLLVSYLCLNACQVLKPMQPDDPKFAPVLTDLPEESKGRNGSLFVSENCLELYKDNRAHKVGDMIMVQLSEITTASKEAKTDISKSDNVKILDADILGTGAAFNLPSKLPLKIAKDLNLSASINSNNAFKGNGKSGQNNSLDGLITVTVDKILPNRSLSIRGEKWITLNQGAEYIRLTGIIRAEDIGPDNTIESKRIADARITYSGTGMQNDANTRGWLSRFFTSGLMPI